MADDDGQSVFHPIGDLATVSSCVCCFVAVVVFVCPSEFVARKVF